MFGKFENINAFLDSYLQQEESKRLEHLHSLSLQDQLAALKASQPVDIAEVQATIKQREADDTATPKHYQMTIILDEILQSAADIKSDMQQCLSNHLPVFVAIRYGDRMGIVTPITSGMNTGDKLHLKGQWISADKAYSHGGAKMSVLHFTHHPYGFTCTINQCYS